MSRRRDDVWRRRWLALGIAAALSIVLPLVSGHRGTHMAMNLLLPGAGLFGVHTLAAIGFVLLAIAALGLWLRWGMDWTVVMVLIAAMVASAIAVHDHTATALAPQRSAHEFPLVILIVGALSRVERWLRRFPPIAALHRRRAARREGLSGLAPVDRCRAVSIAALAGDATADAATAPDIRRRARRVGIAARARFGGDPLRVDHAHARSALVLTGRPADRFVADAAATAAGVPCSEPGWLRLLDATVAAATLHRLGQPDAVTNLRALLAEELRLKRGHRPAAWWTVLGIRTGPSAAWEHVAASSVARALGAIGDDDWAVLRKQCLGASARGTADPHDERTIAAARIWLVFVDDPTAATIVARPTVGRDALAIALDRLADRLHADPGLLHRQTPSVAA